MSKTDRHDADVVNRLQQLADDPDKMRLLLEACGDEQHIVMYSVRHAKRYGAVCIEPWAVIDALLKVIDRLLQQNANLGAEHVLRAGGHYVMHKQHYLASVKVTEEFLRNVDPSMVENAIAEHLACISQSLCQQVSDMKRKEQEA